jgi:hypothetical protein
MGRKYFQGLIWIIFAGLLLAACGGSDSAEAETQSTNCSKRSTAVHSTLLYPQPNQVT